MQNTQTVPAPQLGIVQKTRFAAACALAAGLLASVGWMVMAPSDPAEAVMIMGHGTNAIAGLAAGLPAMLLLVAVTTALATVVAGKHLPEAGLFAVGVGLAALALRGGSMQVMLAYHTSAAPAEPGKLESQLTAGREALMIQMAIDCLLWAAVILLAYLTMVAVTRWLWNEQNDNAGSQPAKARGTRAKSITLNGWPALVITAVVAMFVVSQTIAREPVSGIERGQVIAVVAAALFLGAAAARYFTGISDPRWYLIAPLVVALVGYCLGYIKADLDGFPSYRMLAVTPVHNLARPLPIEYIAVGVSGTLAGFWFGKRVEHAAEHANP